MQVRLTCRALIHSARAYSSPSSARPATVLASSPTPSRPPPPPPAPSTDHRSEPYIPTPIPRSTLAKPTLTSLSPHSPTHTTLHFGSGQLTLPNYYLRDTSIHPDHLHPASQQKLFRTTDVPLDDKLVGWGVNEVDGHECLITEWNEPVAGQKLAVTPLARLFSADKPSLPVPSPTPWSRATLHVLEVPYSSYSTSANALLQTLTALFEQGIVILRDVPTENHETIKAVVERIGVLRRTWYGDVWDVKAVPGSKNIAYTNLDLGLHMDLTHFESPPRFQFLHCLSNHLVTGGKSYFVDSFHLASLLSPSDFDTLSTVPVHFSYRNGGQHTSFLRPTFELSPLSKELTAVNYSPPFQGPLPLSSATPSLYSALSEFARLSGDPQNIFEIQLQKGDLVAFDNRRVLHARTGFEVQKGGERWLKGAYLDATEARSRWRVVKEELDAKRQS